MIRRALLVTCLCVIMDGPALAATPAAGPGPSLVQVASTGAHVPVAPALASRCHRRTARSVTKRCRTWSARRKSAARPGRSTTPARPVATPPVAATPSGPTPNAPAPLGPCANADLVPAQGNADALRSAVACLVNQERAKVGLGALTVAGELQSAADAFSLRMVLEKFFAHVAPDGSALLDRVLSTGYAGGGRPYQLAENIGYATGTLATPAAMVQAWMTSPAHRENILTPSYRETGVGVAMGVPSGGGESSGATFTQDFGAR